MNQNDQTIYSKIILWVFLFSILSACVQSYYHYIVKKDFLVTQEASLEAN